MSELIAGNSKLDKLTINDIELLAEAVTDLTIFESVVQPGITGNMTLSDFQGIKELKEIFAGDTLKVTVSSEGRPPLTLEFVIYASEGDSLLTNQTYQGVKFSFCSRWLFDAGLTVQMSKPFENKYIHEIVKELLEECGAKIGFIEETSQKLESFVSPLWTPVHTIRHLLSFATNKSGVGGYIIWTGVDDDLVYVTTVDYLFREEYGIQEEPFIFRPQNINYENRIVDATFETNYDAIRFSSIGLGKITNLGVDWNDGLRIVKKDESFNAVPHKRLGTKSPVRSDMNTKEYGIQRFTSIYPRMAGRTKPVDVDLLVEADQRSRYGLLMNDVFKVNISTMANSERRAGMMVDVDYPHVDETNHPEQNTRYKGKWLIRDIRHSISPKNYYQHICLCSDGFKKSEREDMVEWVSR